MTFREHRTISSAAGLHVLAWESVMHHVQVCLLAQRGELVRRGVTRLCECISQHRRLRGVRSNNARSRAAGRTVHCNARR